MAGTAALAADTLYILVVDPVDTAIMHLKGALQVELIYAYRTKVAQGQEGALWQACAVLISAVT